jgi:hypothetical protein
MELVTHEMSWTVNCFQRYEKMWQQRAEEAKGPGQIAYAWKQSSTWERWGRVARDTFETLSCV